MDGFVASMRKNRSRSIKGLLQSRAQRDELAFQKLHEQTWEEIFTIAFRKLKDEDEAYDLVQELYIDLWEKSGGEMPYCRQ